MSVRRVIVGVGLLWACGCGDKPDDGEAGDGPAPSSTGGAATEMSGMPTADATGASAEGTTAGVVDTCEGRPGGGWNACFADGHINNDLCGWTMGSGAGTPSCLGPTSGVHHVCGIIDCVDDCDCYAPPATGTAPVLCNEVLANGGKACVLYCVNGQTCPDGMECVSGACYWPH